MGIQALQAQTGLFTTKHCSESSDRREIRRLMEAGYSQTWSGSGDGNDLGFCSSFFSHCICNWLIIFSLCAILVEHCRSEHGRVINISPVRPAFDYLDSCLCWMNLPKYRLGCLDEKPGCIPFTVANCVFFPYSIVCQHPYTFHHIHFCWWFLFFLQSCWFCHSQRNISAKWLPQK